MTEKEIRNHTFFTCVVLFLLVFSMSAIILLETELLKNRHPSRCYTACVQNMRFGPCIPGSLYRIPCVDEKQVSGGATQFKSANMMWVDRGNFQEFLTRTPRAILMIGSMWAWNSQEQANILETYALQDSEVTIGVLDLDEHERFGNRFGIDRTPTVIFYLNGIETGRESGLQPIERFNGR